MSAQASFWAWEQNVHGIRKLVLLNLADTADHEGVSWPSQKRIATMCGLSVATVKRSIDELEEGGYLEREQRFREDGGRTSSVYRLALKRAEVGSESAGTPAPAEPTPSSEGATKNLISEPTQKEPDAPARIWARYVELMEPRNAELDPQVRALIREALKVGSVDEWLRALDGCYASDVHMGRRGIGDSPPKKYNKPSHIFRGKRGKRTTREQLDLFLDFAEKAGPGGSVSSVDPVRLSHAKRNVLDAWEFPGNEEAQKAGEMSAAWLAQHGVRVERAEGGRPTFHAEGSA